jgi:hypothetical protein
MRATILGLRGPRTWATLRRMKSHRLAALVLSVSMIPAARRRAEA